LKPRNKGGKMFFQKIESFLKNHRATDLHGRHIKIKVSDPEAGKIELILKISDVIAKKSVLIIQTFLGITIAAYFEDSKKMSFIINPSFVSALKKIVDSMEATEEEFYFDRSFEVEIWKTNR
jgi:hypothetical protein